MYSIIREYTYPYFFVKNQDIVKNSQKGKIGTEPESRLMRICLRLECVCNTVIF